jgi:CheY-like chemotaxis protein
MQALEVLLVEDNPADALLVREALGKIGIHDQMAQSGDGDSAATFLQEQLRKNSVPDLIILDLNLPGKNGATLLAELKSDPRLRHIPVVVFSSSQSDFDIARSYQLGANCYVAKPLDLQRFFWAVGKIADFWYGCASLAQKKRGIMNE